MSEVSEKRTSLLRQIIETITLTLLILTIIRFGAQGYRTEGQSMEPNFHNDEYVLVNKAAYLFQQPQRGDVIVFHYPFDIHKDFIKRIIGLPHDTIHLNTTGVSINGHLIQEPFSGVSFNLESNTWNLGPDQFFVMGDNRNNSLDSRVWGPLERSYIIGKVVVAYWPLNDLELVNTYPGVYAAIDPNH